MIAPSRALAPSRARIEPARLCWIAFGIAALGAAVLILRVTRGTTLWFDDWIWALNRRSGLHTLLTPYNEHFSLVPILIYRALFAVGGIHDYVPYRIVVTAGHLLCATLLFMYVRQRAGHYLALLAAALILFLGPGWQNFLWPFQIAWLISLSCGIAALLALDRHDRLGDAAASCLLTIGVASSSVGLALLAGVVVEIIWKRRRWGDVWIVAVPVAIYLAWSLAYQHASLVASDVFAVPRWSASSAAATISTLLGLGGQTITDQNGTLLQFGVPLALIVLFALVWRVRRTGISHRAVTIAVSIVVFWVLTAIGRAFLGSPYSSRYLYVDCVLVLLFCAEVARGVALRRAAAVVCAAVVAAAVLSNAGSLRDAGGYLRSQAPLARADLAALDIARRVVPAAYIPAAFPGYPFVVFRANQYFAAEASLGTPAYSSAQLALAPEPAREVADTELIAIHGVSFRARAAGGPGGPAPRLESVSGGSVSARGACVAFVPAPLQATGNPAQVQVAVPAAGLLVRAAGPTDAAIRRFAGTFQELGTLRGGLAAELRISADSSPQPWHLQLKPSAPVSVCGV